MVGKCFAALLGSALLMSASPAREMRAFPSVIMIRGGELKAPLVLHHVYNKADPHAFQNDPIVRLYSSLGRGADDVELSNSVQYEVAVFWGPQWVRKYGEDGRPIAGLRFLDANRTALLFVTSKGIVWTPVGADGFRPGLSPRSGKAIGDEGANVLFAAGLPRPK